MTFPLVLNHSPWGFRLMGFRAALWAQWGALACCTWDHLSHLWGWSPPPPATVASATYPSAATLFFSPSLLGFYVKSAAFWILPMNQNFSVCGSSPSWLYLLTSSPATREHIHLLFITNYIDFHLKLRKFINTLDFTGKKPMNRKC